MNSKPERFTMKNRIKFSSKSSIIFGFFAVISSLAPQLAHAQNPVEQSVEGNIDNPREDSSCTFAIWTPTKFKYNLQSGWGVFGGLLGQAAADSANKDKLQDRRNELEKVLDPDVVFRIFQDSNIKNIEKFKNAKFIKLSSDLDPKLALNSQLRSSESTEKCYYEIFVNKVTAEKTIVYGTFFDTQFAVKDFSYSKPLIYKDSIRRKIENFPPKTQSDIDNSYSGVRKVFSEQLDFFIQKYKW